MLSRFDAILRYFYLKRLISNELLGWKIILHDYARIKRFFWKPRFSERNIKTSEGKGMLQGDALTAVVRVNWALGRFPLGACRQRGCSIMKWWSILVGCWPRKHLDEPEMPGTSNMG